ncbi:ATP-dependent RNA helicase-like protein MAK5 [Lindgomyces ingoldianus]|uniref:ATP-dependent RNA helicase-like protein MAK5 n=1 Tax=Lindgomyces ingoldianus TaxID=673940 RepID=A0ACB6QZQ9_9PLEO|nr:ATP-dependent RNA helicase-like protein MAK5 [Lindgomyces ingoldianus]KAF2472549.1 ATP-dependent RNA helicase-like protein MAK5 [Lindgomyces ingoldianus]
MLEYLRGDTVERVTNLKISILLPLHPDSHRSTMKRGLPPKIAAIKARKRQKLDQSAQSSTVPTKAASKRCKVKLDDLQWEEVAMPDRLEDFEGFYGLEEIEDVAVVRDAITGTISFESSTLDSLKKKDAGQSHSGAAVLHEPEDGFSDEGSWMGFSDKEGGAIKEYLDEKDAQDLSENSLRTMKAAERKMKKRQKQKKKQDHGKTSVNRKGAFDILADQPLSGDDDVDEVDVSAWGNLGLSSETLRSLARLRFSQPTLIQSSAIPEILSGHDVVGKASTGSGKTLAFGIPILERFLASSQAERLTPLALIISPTRELAHQLTAHLTALCSGSDFNAPSIAAVTGGLSVQKQRRQLENADVVVGTPGRLWEVISSGQGLVKSFKQIQFLVVDEADRLLSEGHYKELGKILKILDCDEEKGGGDSNPDQTPELQRQTLVFSATFYKGLQQKLVGKAAKGGDLLNKQESMEYLLKKVRFLEGKPKFIDANPSSQMASRLKEGLIECAGTEKDLYLYALLLFHPKKRSLIFTNSISAVRRVTPFLQNLNLVAHPLHSQMPQKSRLRSVERFTTQPGSILVATDVAARGLDIPGVDLIVHYHLPRAADTYVHRSGRTARAKASGISVLICAPEEVAGVRRLVAKVHARPQQTVKSKNTAYFIRTLDLDRRIVSRCKPRATLAKKLADAVIAKEKIHSEDAWLSAAAEDLGVDYNSDTFEAEAPGRQGRGSGRKKKQNEAGATSKGEMQALRAELKALLSQRVNVGVSAKYLTGGGVDMDALLNGEGNAEFLGTVDGLGFEA